LSTAACIFTAEAYHHIVRHDFAHSMVHPVSFCTVNILSVLHFHVHKVRIVRIVPHRKNKVDPPTMVDCRYVDYCVLFVTQNIEICSTEHVKSQHINTI